MRATRTSDYSLFISVVRSLRLSARISVESSDSHTQLEEEDRLREDSSVAWLTTCREPHRVVATWLLMWGVILWAIASL